MQRVVPAYIGPGEQSGFVADCPLLNVVTQGVSLDETVAALREARALAIDDPDFAELGLANPPIVIPLDQLAPQFYVR